MNALTPHLRALHHPLTLTSIGMLLLNDHIFKAAVPSWLTGKLSDFAGLFFFPFVLAAALAWPGHVLRWPARRVLALACGLTGLWFALIKTVPWANTLTIAALTQLLGQPAQIILDPTDLLALPMIGMAGWLWVRLEKSSAQQVNRRRGYWALGVAALATLATSPCPPPLSVQRAVAVNNTIYIGPGPDWSSGELALQYESTHHAWNPVDPFLPEAALALRENVSLPRQVCDPQNPAICYRVDGRPRVEMTENGGQTWRVVWQIPWGRAAYMKRLYQRPLACRPPEFELKTYDVAFLPNGSPNTVVVAMGWEGVVVRKSNGQWEREGLSGYNYTGPTPYTASDPAELIFTLAPENAAVVIAFILTLILLPILGRKRLLHNAAGAARVMSVTFAAAFSLLGAWLPFVFWAYGLIPEYFLALALALLLAGATYVIGWRAIKPTNEMGND